LVYLPREVESLGAAFTGSDQQQTSMAAFFTGSTFSPSTAEFPYLLQTGVAVEKLLPVKFSKIKLRQLRDSECYGDVSPTTPRL